MQCSASPLGAFESRFFRAVQKGASFNAVAGSNDLPFQTVEFSSPYVTTEASGLNFTLQPGTYYIEVQFQIWNTLNAVYSWVAGAQSGHSGVIRANNNQMMFHYTFKVTLASQGNFTQYVTCEQAQAGGLGTGGDVNAVVRFLNIWRLY